MGGAGDHSPISADEAAALFGDLAEAPALLIAVSGGPHSTALLWLAARWHKKLKRKPKLTAVTVDHGLRKAAKREAADAGKLAKQLGVPHRIVMWRGKKPTTGIQQQARRARYALLGEAAAKAGATHILTAHTRDDQAETVVMRMARGSGLTGLGGMARRSRLAELILVRPLLDVPKTRLIATLKTAKVSYAEDPSNVDPAFTRARLRRLLPLLAAEGLDARRLSALARRLRRADAALDAEAERAAAALSRGDQMADVFPAAEFVRLPAEIALRLLGRAVTRLGAEGPVELGKLEALAAATLLAARNGGRPAFRRTLAGALVSVSGGELRVETAPARRSPVLTKRRAAAAAGRKKR